jgi:CRP-like cAMP-binding protein
MQAIQRGKIKTMSIFHSISEAATELGLPFDISSQTGSKFDVLASRQRASEDHILIPQNGLADRLYFLLSGRAQFTKRRRTSATRIATVTSAMVPLGVSGLNSPGRYMSEVQLSAGSTYIVLELAALRDLFVIDPSFAAQFLSFVLTKSTELVWATRGLPASPPADDTLLAAGVAHGSDHDVARRLSEAPFFSPLSADRIAELMNYSELRLFSTGETIVAEGQLSTAIHILFSGRVLAAYTDARDGGPKLRVRTIVRPGIALSWQNGYTDIEAPYTVTA